NQNFGQPYPNYGNSLNSQTQATRNTQKRTYVVKAGDTVASVANKNGISILSLCRLNMLSTNEPLQPGRMLKLR
ncbi:MAG: LysM peptidoglycan-binding domain-containing protein, partial [Muribaculaceae bacterium]|nr:LysM peptidoglycan-binding domain-containing protein [Muribaculaceae bacterium]